MKTPHRNRLHGFSDWSRLLPVVILSLGLVGCSDSSERTSDPTGGGNDEGTGAFTTAVALRVTEGLRASSVAGTAVDGRARSGEEHGVVSVEARTAAFHVTAPVQWAADCPFPVAGLVALDLGGPVPARLDYGAGRCDDRALLSVDGDTREIRLSLRR